MKTTSPKLIIAALVAGFLVTGTFAFPLHPESAVAKAELNWLSVRAPAGPRPPKHRPDSDSDMSEPDPKRIDEGSSGSDSGDASGAVSGPVWGSAPENPAQQAPAPDQPSGPFGGTVGSIPIDQAGVPAPQPINPDIANLQTKGGSNIDRINTAKSGNAPVNNHDYDQKFASNYFRKVEPNANANVSPDVKNWLSENGIDINAPDVVKVRVFGTNYDPEAPNSPPSPGPAPSRNSDSNSDSDDGFDSDSSKAPDDRSIMEAYMSPAGGWMYRTRMFRDKTYDNFYSLPYEERLPISEIMNRQWTEAAGNAPLKKVVGANVEADDTKILLGDLKTTSGANQGTITPDDPRFNQAMGSSQGNVVAFMLKDHHSEPIAGAGLPTSVSWRFTGENALDSNQQPTDYADSFLLVNIG